MSLPPKTNRGRYDWQTIVKTLKSQPGEWVCVLQREPRTVYRAITHKTITVLRDDPEFEFEVTTRNNSHTENRCDYWMRAVEKKEQSDAAESHA